MHAGESNINLQAHWQEVYRTKEESQFSWHQDQPVTSLELICAHAPARGDVIDIGAGTSTLPRVLINAGFHHVTVLDLASNALERSKQRNNASNDPRFSWLVADIASPCQLPVVDVWHDRAVFHFLTQPSEQKAYAENLSKSLKAGGLAVIAAFAPSGPQQCSGLPVLRHDAASILRAIQPYVELEHALDVAHITPWGKAQPFTYAVLRRTGTI